MSTLKPRHKLLSFILICTIFPFYLSAQTNLKNISVLRFLAQNVSPVEAEIVSDLLSVALVESKQYSVIDRNNMDKILKEQSFQQTGCTDSECAVQIGRLLNMDYMITGTLAKLGSSYFITVSIIDVETSRIEQSFRSPGFVMDNVEAVIVDVSGRIIKEFAPSATAENQKEIERKSAEQAQRLEEERNQRELAAQKAAEAEAKRIADERKKQELAAQKAEADKLKEAQRKEALAKKQAQTEKEKPVKKSGKPPVNRKLVLTAGSGVITVAGIITGSAMKSASESTYSLYSSSSYSDEAELFGNKYETYMDRASFFFSVGEAGLVLTSALGLWTIADAVVMRKKSLKVSVMPVITRDNKKAVICAALSF